MYGKKILVVDDEAHRVELLRERLGRNGYEVISAAGGLEGLEKANKENPDLILLDIMMFGMDGFEVLRKLRSEPETKDIPVIMLTAKADTDSIFRAEDLKSADYIIKPFDFKELLDLIEKYIL